MIAMRDPRRINNFCVELGCLWQDNFPDWRFGQLVSNFAGWCQTKKRIDIFHLEEDKFLALLQEYVNSFGKG